MVASVKTCESCALYVSEEIIYKSKIESLKQTQKEHQARVDELENATGFWGKLKAGIIKEWRTSRYLGCTWDEHVVMSIQDEINKLESKMNRGIAKCYLNPAPETVSKDYWCSHHKKR